MVITLFFAAVVRQRRHRALLPGPDPHRLDVDRHPGPRAHRRASLGRERPIDRRSPTRRAPVRLRPATAPRPSLATAVLLVPTALAIPTATTPSMRARETDARRWVDAALAAMDPDAVVVSWWSYSTPLWYAQHVEGRRPDIASWTTARASTRTLETSTT